MAPKPRLAALTGLRAAAALAVAATHMPDLLADKDLPRTARRVAAEGAAGVTFFFVLSGFVLAYSYHDRLARPTRAALTGYAAGRVGRMWPLHLLTFALAAAWPVGPHPPEAGPAVANVLLVHAWVPDLRYVQSFNSVSWSLSLEVFFYLWTPALLWAVGRWRAAGPVGLTATAAGLLAALAGYVWWHARHLGPDTLFWTNTCPPVRMAEFAAGLLLGVAYVRGGAGRADPLLGGRARVRWAWTAAEAAAVGLLVGMAARSHHVSPLLRLVGYYAPGAAVVVAVFARERGYLSWLAAGRVPAYLGAISFAFFLLHPVVFVYLGPRLGTGLGSVGRAAVLVAVTGVLSAVAYHAVEVPGQGWIVGRVGRPRPATS